MTAGKDKSAEEIPARRKSYLRKENVQVCCCCSKSGKRKTEINRMSQKLQEPKRASMSPAASPFLRSINGKQIDVTSG